MKDGSSNLTIAVISNYPEYLERQKRKQNYQMIHSTQKGAEIVYPLPRPVQVSSCRFLTHGYSNETFLSFFSFFFFFQNLCYVICYVMIFNSAHSLPRITSLSISISIKYIFYTRSI